MGVVIFNGISSKDYGIQVEHPPGYLAPARDYEAVHIPGRNGDLVIDNGSFQNVTRSYEVAVGDEKEDFTAMANRIAEWANSAAGYARLEDSYEPEYYRMAMFQGEISVENILQHAGRATLDFNCKPQRFLKSGDKAFRLEKPTVLRNPTGFAALPEVTVYGSGQGVVDIGGFQATVNDIRGSVVLDSEIQDAYKVVTLGTTSTVMNRNSAVILKDGFPKLLPGENLISWSGGVSYVEVVPRWWTL